MGGVPWWVERSGLSSRLGWSLGRRGGAKGDSKLSHTPRRPPCRLVRRNRQPPPPAAAGVAPPHAAARGHVARCSWQPTAGVSVAGSESLRQLSQTLPCKAARVKDASPPHPAGRRGSCVVAGGADAYPSAHAHARHSRPDPPRFPLSHGRISAGVVPSACRQRTSRGTTTDLHDRRAAHRCYPHGPPAAHPPHPLPVPAINPRRAGARPCWPSRPPPSPPRAAGAPPESRRRGGAAPSRRVLAASRPAASPCTAAAAAVWCERPPHRGSGPSRMGADLSITGGFPLTGAGLARLRSPPWAHAHQTRAPPPAPSPARANKQKGPPSGPPHPPPLP